MADSTAAQHDPRHEWLMAQAQAARDRAKILQRRAEEALASNRASMRILARTLVGRQRNGTRRDMLQRSEFLRLVARAETMPVIERAKGVIMMQSRCGEDEAFEMLRRASQRSNIPVRELASHIVNSAGRVRLNGDSRSV